MGIIISMNYNDHAPPHFHVRYGEHKALLALRPLRLLAGRLPPRIFGSVMEWAATHQQTLDDNWNLARQSRPLVRIPPLE
jgi:hypothetical protein